MVRTRSALFLAVAGIVSFAACNKEGDKKTADNKAVETDKPSTAPSAAPAGSASGGSAATTPSMAQSAPAAAPPAADMVKAPPAAATVNPNADDLSLLPVDSELVIGVNWKQMTASPLWKEFVAPKLATDPNFQNGITKFKTLCNFDPTEALTSLSGGFRHLDSKSPDGAIVIHGFDRTKSMACFDKDGKTEAEKDGSKVTIEDNVVLIQKPNEPSVGFTFVNDSTALVVLGAKADTTAGVKELAAGKTALGTSPNFVEIYNKVNTGDSVWFLANGNSKMFAEATAKLPNVKLKAVFGSLNVADGVTADVRVRVDSPDQAKMLADLGNKQAAGAAMFVDKLEIAADGSDIHAAMSISNTKLHTLMQFAAMGKQQHAGGGGGGGLFGPH